MSLAANDAFSLGLAHSGPRRRPLTRSSSPKLSPVALFNQSNQGKGRQNIRRRMIRRLSNLQPVSTEVAVNGAQDHNRTPLDAVRKDGKRPTTPPDREKNRSSDIDWEIPRKTLHSSIGFLTIYLYASQTTSSRVIRVLCAALAIIIPADILRFRYPRFARLYESQLGFLMRESEKSKPNGVIWYLLGVIFSLAVYPLDIAVVAILILAWADTAASTFGRLFGSRTPPLPRRVPFLLLPFAPRKSLAGFAAASITGAATAMIFWTFVAPLRPNNLSWEWNTGLSRSAFPSMLNVGINAVTTRGWIGLGAIGVVAGIVAGVAEALDLSLDDNLTLPIISGASLYGFFKVLGLCFS